MKLLKVYPFLAGEILVDESYHFRGREPGKILKTPSYIFYIEGAKEKILVDTSFDSPEKIWKTLKMRCDRKPDHALTNLLTKVGVTPKEIDIVIYTHLHWDHIGNSKLFTNAKFICQREELKWAIAPPSWEIGYSRALILDMVEMIEKLEPISGDKLIIPGVEVWELGGHTPGSQAVAVKTNKGIVAIAGDNVSRYENLERGIPTGLFYNLEQSYRALDILQRRSDVIIPAHDWKVLERYSV